MNARKDSVIYQGQRHARGTSVWVRISPSKSERLDAALHLRAHSPTGFEWGFGGSGPAQLAFAILYDCTEAEFALANYQAFKEQHVARIQTPSWAIEAGEVRRMIGWRST